MKGHSWPRASVIVCTYNRSTLLRRLLESLERQTIPLESFEIIVVDDGSNDDTPVVCQEMAARMNNIRYIRLSSNSGLSAAGNRAVAESASQYLLFTDDDCLPHTHWVEEMCAGLNDFDIVAGAIASPLANYVKLCHNIAQFFPFMPGQKSSTMDFIAGANMGIRARAMKEIGEFNINSVIPDMEFILRAREKGFKIGYTPGAMITHDPCRVTMGDVLKYAAHHASHTILLRHRYRELLRTPFVLFSPVLILFGAPIIALKATFRIYLGNRKMWRYFHTVPTVYLLKLAWCWGAARGLWAIKRKRKH